jgi:hypothetical protein
MADPKYIRQLTEKVSGLNVNDIMHLVDNVSNQDRKIILGTLIERVLTELTEGDRNLDIASLIVDTITSIGIITDISTIVNIDDIASITDIDHIGTLADVDEITNIDRIGNVNIDFLNCPGVSSYSTAEIIATQTIAIGESHTDDKSDPIDILYPSICYFDADKTTLSAGAVTVNGSVIYIVTDAGDLHYTRNAHESSGSAVKFLTLSTSGKVTDGAILLNPGRYKFVFTSGSTTEAVTIQLKRVSVYGKNVLT